MWWKSKKQSSPNATVPQSDSPGKPTGTPIDTQSVAASDATTLVPGTADAVSARGLERPRPADGVQPTGLDVSPEAVMRAAARREQEAPVDTSYMSEEEKARLRAKGINPELKAEMDAKVYGKRGAKTKLGLLGNAWG